MREGSEAHKVAHPSCEAQNVLSRPQFFYGTLLAGNIPKGGFTSAPSLKAAGYKPPNESLNLASIGAGGMPPADGADAQAGVENVVALADCDWDRGAPGFAMSPKAAKYKDFRQMLDTAPYTEWPVLGAAASHYAGELLWNYEKMEFTNNKRRHPMDQAHVSTRLGDQVIGASSIDRR